MPLPKRNNKTDKQRNAQNKYDLVHNKPTESVGKKSRAEYIQTH